MSEIVNKGDMVILNGKTYVIEKVLYAYYWHDWDIEFIDNKGNYHHWKQYFDGGDFKPRDKKYIDYYGCDVTDIFKKYGYK